MLEVGLENCSIEELKDMITKEMREACPYDKRNSIEHPHIKPRIRHISPLSIRHDGGGFLRKGAGFVWSYICGTLPPAASKYGILLSAEKWTLLDVSKGLVAFAVRRCAQDLLGDMGL